MWICGLIDLGAERLGIFSGHGSRYPLQSFVETGFKPVSTKGFTTIGAKGRDLAFLEWSEKCPPLWILLGSIDVVWSIVAFYALLFIIG